MMAVIKEKKKKRDTQEKKNNDKKKETKESLSSWYHVETQKDIERHFIDVCLKYKEELLFIL